MVLDYTNEAEYFPITFLHYVITSLYNHGMGYESEGGKETLSPSKSASPPTMTLQKAVDMGEYDPEYLATFPEWHTLSQHVQFQFVKQGLDNRNNQLVTSWAETVNMLDFSKKPHLAEALKNIENQMKKLDRDRERLYLEFSKG
ncbi:hypothetical protein A2124_02830 [Candidatus Woesebacteria bacterium GWB1_37_5]|nr:MAG: hypothetical protein A2124_02830 [Candidatus Woesebacteria bacterium GWB1_37_5]